jgi:DNA polymerase (family 10)
MADHSQLAHYAGGLRLDAIGVQHETIGDLNRRYRGGFRILKGIESDILADGALDYPPDILERFDLIVASVHSRFRLAREEQTKRILAAVANPFTTILGHLTGRQLLRRSGYDFDVEAILEACAAHGVAVEINANPGGWSSTGAGTARRWALAACSASIRMRTQSLNSIF